MTHEMAAVHVIRMHWSRIGSARAVRPDDDGKVKLLDDWTGVVEDREKGVKGRRR